jgi:hypothetical protein
MAKPHIGLVALALLATVGAWSSAVAADRSIPRRAAEAYREYEITGPWVTYVYHRDLRQTYGTGVDPRNYDETEPHYYFGPVRRYVRFCRYWECQY